MVTKGKWFQMTRYLNLNRCHSVLSRIDPIRSTGKVTKVIGMVTEADGPGVPVGAICDIHPLLDNRGRESKIKAEVIGFRDDRVLLMPLEETRGIAPGSRVVARDEEIEIRVGEGLLGRIIDGLGNPIDGKGPVHTTRKYPVYGRPINPVSRTRIREPLDMGIRALNGALTIGRGQRMGIFSGSGVGKSTLLGMIARMSRADVNVIALIGERGRELNDFIQRNLGEDGLKRSVVVVATSDQLPVIRMRGAFTATAIAEFFRDQGEHVILMMDSLTRFAMAQREIGLAAGEPPTTKGYTPSVFTLLPKLVERAGTCSGKGTITGLYTVLVEGDDMNEPIADAARALLDGHTVLSRDLAERNHYPAIDVLASISRLMIDVTKPEHRVYAEKLKETLAIYRKSEDLINIGAYVRGSNPKIDAAISLNDSIKTYLCQGITESASLPESVEGLRNLFEK